MTTEVKDNCVISNIEPREKEAVVLVTNQQSESSSPHIYACYNNHISSSLYHHSSVIVIGSDSDDCDGGSHSNDEIYQEIEEVRDEMFDSLKKYLSIKKFEEYIASSNSSSQYIDYLKKRDVLLASKSMMSKGTFVMYYDDAGSGDIDEGGGTYLHNDLQNRDYLDSHPISAITGLVDVLALKSEVTHTHDWGGLLGKPTTFTPSAHIHSWINIAGKPSTFTPSTHFHSWINIAGRPSTFTPSAHTHSQYVNKVAGYPLEIVNNSGTWWQKINTVDSTDLPVHRFQFQERQGSVDYIELFGVDGYGELYAKGRKVWHSGNFHPSDIQVGGTNLLINSGRGWDTINWLVAKVVLVQDHGLKEGDLVTVTIKGAVLATGKKYFDIFNSGGTVSLFTAYASDIKDGLIVKTIKWKIGTSSNSYLNIYHQSYLVTGVNSKIEWVKLERGNKGTDWTPAHEEVWNKYNSNLYTVDWKAKNITTAGSVVMFSTGL